MKIGVIADDLTGANATGVMLSKQGITSATLFAHSAVPEREMAVIIDTDSRYLPEPKAKQRVMDAVRKLQHWGAFRFCKRIDSTFRGNIGAELDVMLDCLGDHAAAVVVPAYPESGRKAVGGYLLVHGIPLAETDVAKDPIKPLKHSFIPSLLMEQSEHPVGFIDLQTVGQGASAIEEEMRRQLRKGIRLIVCDAVTEEHIGAIANAMIVIPDCLLIPADPGPLTNHFIRLSNPHEREKRTKILLTVGSATSVTQQQLGEFIRHFVVDPININPQKLISIETQRDEIERVVQEAALHLHQHETLLLTTNHPGQERLDLRALAQQKGVEQHDLAKRITDGLAEISKQVIAQAGSITGCFFSGGDVAASFCEAVSADGIMLLDEVMPLAAYGHIMGGPFDGLAVVTKGGLVGNEHAVIESVQFLKRILQI